MDKALKLTKLFARTPPTPEDGGPKLVTIAFSHYCEKARWALDLSPWRDVYLEDSHMPVFHIPPVLTYSMVRRYACALDSAACGLNNGPTRAV